jgi:large subunit ribosomal protein L18
MKTLAGWHRRKTRVRKKISGFAGRPRLNIYRSNKHIYAQIVDDTMGKTLIAAGTNSKELRKKLKGLKKTEAAKKVGEHLGKIAREKGIEKVVFDRSGYLYHGRVKALAEGARQTGLGF